MRQMLYYTRHTSALKQRMDKAMNSERQEHMTIRKAAPTDLPSLLPIYAYAREQMKSNGNPDQWGDSRPSADRLKQDIADGNLYLIEENGQIYGSFAFIVGDDPTYRIIEGSWKNDHPYGTIHRLAAGVRGHHIFAQCLAYCEAIMTNIRIDTHEHNNVMRQLLHRYGFQECGIIYTDNGTPRIAYQKY